MSELSVWKRREAGLCVRCGSDQREPTITMCRPCADKQNDHVKRYQARKRAQEAQTNG